MRKADEARETVPRGAEALLEGEQITPQRDVARPLKALPMRHSQKDLIIFLPANFGAFLKSLESLGIGTVLRAARFVLGEVAGTPPGRGAVAANAIEITQDLGMTRAHEAFG